jgi:hypothetical protein
MANKNAQHTFSPISGHAAAITQRSAWHALAAGHTIHSSMPWGISSRMQGAPPQASCIVDSGSWMLQYGARKDEHWSTCWGVIPPSHCLRKFWLRSHLSEAAWERTTTWEKTTDKTIWNRCFASWIAANCILDTSQSQPYCHTHILRTK